MNDFELTVPDLYFTVINATTCSSEHMPQRRKQITTKICIIIYHA